ncbi:MAG TPA: hypothetical protein VFB96_18750 [Pirellulaceae bacterium]|nr:hypothetical protein [Pirellulaceae bacterium]
MFVRPARPPADYAEYDFCLLLIACVDVVRFNSQVLDDVLLACSVGMHEVARGILIRTAYCQIGAFLELVLSQRQSSQMSANSEVPNTDVSAAFTSIRQPESSEFLNLTPQAVEFCACPRSDSGFNSPGWMAFGKRLQYAAESAGFSNSISAGIAGAFQEMADNATTHSQAAATALGGYQWGQNEFEFVVADVGIGVLQSLRTCSEFVSVNDHADALALAVTRGASRFGSGTGHGNGFRQLFTSLASLGGELRFRSGDQALTVAGETLNKTGAQLSQRPEYRGFLVSARCRS